MLGHTLGDRMRNISLILALATLSSLTGCITSSVVQTAETAGKDNFQFTFEPGVMGIAASGTSTTLPSFNIAARYGIDERVDIGGRFGTNLLEVNAKFMVTEVSPDELQIAVAPHLGGFALSADGATAGIVWLRVPVLFDIPVGQSDVVIGPTGRLITLFGGDGGGSGAVTIFDLGTSVGYAARVGNRARIIPEVGFGYPIVGAAAAGGDSAFGAIGGGALFSFQVGIQLGGRPKTPDDG